jgi:hypothetical protein
MPYTPLVNDQSGLFSATTIHAADLIKACIVTTYARLALLCGWAGLT